MSDKEELNIQEKTNHQEETIKQDNYQGEHSHEEHHVHEGEYYGEVHHHHHHHDYEDEHHHHHHHHHHGHQDLDSNYFRKSSPRRKRDRIQKLVFAITVLIAIGVILFALWVTSQTN